MTAYHAISAVDLIQKTARGILNSLIQGFPRPEFG